MTMEPRKAILITGAASNGCLDMLHSSADLVATASPGRERGRWIAVAASGREAG